MRRGPVGEAGPRRAQGRPDAGADRAGDIGLEAPGGASQGPLHTVGDPRVAPVEDLPEQGGQAGRGLLRNPFGDGPGDERLRGNAHTGHLATRRRTHDLGGLGEGQGPWSGHLVQSSAVPLLGQGPRRGLGDVVQVDEGFGHVRHGQGQDPGVDRAQEEALGEVLGEEGTAHHGQLGKDRAHLLLGASGQGLPAAGQQDRPSYAARDGARGERGHGLGGPGQRQVG